MSTGIKKLQEEHKFLRQKGILATFGACAGPIKKDYLHWRGIIQGPKNTPYEGGTFLFEMKFNEKYPEKGSVIDVQMRTPTYHPNITCSNGHICVDYINDWKDNCTIVGIISSIFQLLGGAESSSNYNGVDIQKAKNFTSKYAGENQNISWDSCWNKGWNNNESI